MGQRIIITPDEIMQLLADEGWRGRPSTHGAFFSIGQGPTYRTTTIPYGRRPIPPSILGQILGPQQTGWGRAGLERRRANKRQRRSNR